MAAELLERPECLIGHVAGRIVAIELTHVVKVLPMMRLEPLPGGPEPLLGFMNMAGAAIPVLGLRRVFGLPDPVAGADVDYRVALCRVGEREVGLVLDEAIGLGRPAPAQEAVTATQTVAQHIVQGMGVVDNALCAILEPANALAWLRAELGEAPRG